jgi:uncharacterized protein (DUF885 family)
MSSLEAGLESIDMVEDQVLNHTFTLNPRYAVFLGLHEYDGMLPDYSMSAVRSWADKAEILKDRLERIDTGSLDPRRKLDILCLQLLLEDDLFDVRELDVHATRPFVYAFPLGVTPYISKPYAPLEERIKSVNKHLMQIPRFLDQAGENLNRSLAEPFVKVSSMMLQGTVQELNGDASLEAAKASQPTRREFEKLRDAAVERINSFLADLKEKYSTNMDFGMGREKFQKVLWTRDRITMSVEEVLDLGLEDLSKNLAALDDTVRKIGVSSLSEAFDLVRRDHSTKESLIQDTAEKLDSLEQFIRDKDIVGIPLDTKCRVVETPLPMRAFASAAMNFPGPFEKANVEGHYYVTPVEDGWDEKRREEWLRYLNHSSMKNVSAHEVYPGHFVHGLHVRAFAKTRTAKAYFNYGFTEGWAHYTEEMMIEAGYGNGDPKLRIVQLEDALLRDCRFIVAFKMHTQGMSLDEAKRFIMENAKLEELPAEREAVRGTFDHGYYGYTLGKLFIKRAKQSYFEQYPSATMRTFHDKLLSLGSAPSGVLEQLVNG